MNINELVKLSGWNCVLRGTAALFGFSAMALLTLTVPARADLMNGNFVLTPASPTSGYQVPVGGPSDLADWSSTAPLSCVFSPGTATSALGGSCILWPGNPPAPVVGPPSATTDSTPPGGGNYYAMDGSAGFSGILSQPVTVIPNTDYVLTFWQSAAQLSGNSGVLNDCGPGTGINTTEQWQVSFTGNASQQSQLMCNASESFYGWEEETMHFATGPTTTTAVLGFFGEGTPNGVPPMVLLADVSLDPVPEPGAWVLLGTVFASVVVGRRRQTKRC